MSWVHQVSQHVDGTFSACLNTKGMLQLILLDQIYPILMPSPLHTLKPARNERVKSMNVIFVLHISAKLVYEVSYMHNYKRAHPQTER